MFLLKGIVFINRNTTYVFITVSGHVFDSQFVTLYLSRVTLNLIMRLELQVDKTLLLTFIFILQLGFITFSQILLVKSRNLLNDPDCHPYYLDFDFDLDRDS